MTALDGEPTTLAPVQTLALTNFGHFTSMRVGDGRVRGLALHVERLVRDSRIVFDVDLDPEHIRHLMRRAAAEHSGTYTMRVTVFDPELEMGHPGSDAAPQLLVTTRPAGNDTLPPLRAQARAFVRELPEVKHIGLMASLFERRQAQRAGYDDALFTGPDGLISEGVTWNIGFYDGTGIVWPKADVLPGVTMALLQQACEHTIAPVAADALGGMEAAFASNVSIGVRPIAAVDHTTFRTDHPVLHALRAAFLADPGEVI